ncbi:MAG: hypothetical protein QM488_06365 [Rhizobiaceae bacterium]
MAKKAADKDAPKEKSSKGPMIMGLLGSICSGLSLIAIITLFAGLYDLGFIDLTHTLEAFAAPALLVLIVASILGPFASSKAAASAKAAALVDAQAIKAETDEKIAAVSQKIETYLGENYNSLREENENMKGEFEKIETAERQKIEDDRLKIDDELVKLRATNADLQEQLNKNAQLIAEQTAAADQLAGADQLSAA